MNKKIIGITGIIALIILTLVVFRFIRINAGESTHIEDTFPGGLPEISDVATQALNPSLKEYKNDELGISFHYPASCGEFRSNSMNGIFQASVDQSGVCPFIYIFAVSKDAVDEVQECGFPEPIKDSDKNYKNKNGVDMAIIEGYGESCFPIEGESAALINLSHAFWVVMIDGQTSSTFMEVLDSVRVY